MATDQTLKHAVIKFICRQSYTDRSALFEHKIQHTPRKGV